MQRIGFFAALLALLFIATGCGARAPEGGSVPPAGATTSAPPPASATTTAPAVSVMSKLSAGIAAG